MYPQRSVMTCGLATALEPPHFNHAPVRGAIGASFSRRSRAGSFNPRTLVGCDWRPCWAFPSASRFQSTHPRGVRRPPSGKPGTAGLFQSTHPRGVRLALIMGLASINKFQSTHPRGVRPMRTNRFRRFFEVSIHAPAWGATGTSCPLRLPLCGFNPRTRVGCDA